MGTLVYNEIVILPCKKLNYMTKKEIAKRENSNKGMLDNDPYFATSPHSGDHLSRVRLIGSKTDEEITQD